MLHMYSMMVHALNCINKIYFTLFSTALSHKNNNWNVCEDYDKKNQEFWVKNRLIVCDMLSEPLKKDEQGKSLPKAFPWFCQNSTYTAQYGMSAFHTGIIKF